MNRSFVHKILPATLQPIHTHALNKNKYNSSSSHNHSHTHTAASELNFSTVTKF